MVFRLSPGPQRIKAWKPLLGTGNERTIVSVVFQMISTWGLGSISKPRKGGVKS